VYRWFQARALPAETEGHITGSVMLLTDLTTVRRADEKLRRSEWNLLEEQRLGRLGSWAIDMHLEL